MTEPSCRGRELLYTTLAVRLLGLAIIVIAVPGVMAVLAWWAKQLSVNSISYVWSYLIGRQWAERLVQLGPVIQLAIGAVLAAWPTWVVRRLLRRAFARTCLNCGYPLPASSPVCPECGEANHLHRKGPDRA